MPLGTDYNRRTDERWCHSDREHLSAWVRISSSVFQVLLCYSSAILLFLKMAWHGILTCKHKTFIPALIFLFDCHEGERPHSVLHLPTLLFAHIFLSFNFPLPFLTYVFCVCLAFVPHIFPHPFFPYSLLYSPFLPYLSLSTSTLFLCGFQPSK